MLHQLGFSLVEGAGSRISRRMAKLLAAHDLVPVYFYENFTAEGL